MTEHTEVRYIALRLLAQHVRNLILLTPEPEAIQILERCAAKLYDRAQFLAALPSPHSDTRQEKP